MKIELNSSVLFDDMPLYAYPGEPLQASLSSCSSHVRSCITVVGDTDSLFAQACRCSSCDVVTYKNTRFSALDDISSP